MNYFLRIVFLILLIEIGVIIGASISKQTVDVRFDETYLEHLPEMTLNEFDIPFNESIKDSKGFGLGKGIIQYSWNLSFEMGLDFTDWDFNSQYSDYTLYIDAPELLWLESDVQFLKQQQLDATKEERIVRMFEAATKHANNQSKHLQQQLLLPDSIYYQHAKFILENKIKTIIKNEAPKLILEKVVIRNWP
ncbi:MAG: hypothetical protein HRU38_03485 [Saccharospirillaceae bacterium]|nr:hypothetical protein [Pseudomonadales bacterium]NRB77725.1 hypothetical protein [Saccharospirillaceae bacterium]